MYNQSEHQENLFEALDSKRFSIVDVDGLIKAALAAFTPWDDDTTVLDSVEISSFVDAYPSLLKIGNKLFLAKYEERLKAILKAVIYQE